jgi:hypothetical protein
VGVWILSWCVQGFFEATKDEILQAMFARVLTVAKNKRKRELEGVPEINFTLQILSCGW